MDIYDAEERVALHAEDEQRILKQHDALGASGHGKLRLAPQGAAARLVLIAGLPIHEPLAR